MKKCFKLLTMFVAFSVLCSFSLVSVSAKTFSSKSRSVTSSINEYELYKTLICESDSQLKKDGYTSQEISDLRNFSFKDAIVARSKKSDSQLQNMGYTDSKIRSLRNLASTSCNSGTDLTENQLIANGLISTLTTTFTMWHCEATNCTVQVVYDWDSIPFINLTDMFTVRWKGTNSQGRPLNLALDNDVSFMCIHYYISSANDAQDHDNIINGYPPKWSVTDAYGCVSSAFEMQSYTATKSPFFDAHSYALEGVGWIKVDTVGSDSINEVAFDAAYGHSIVCLNPSFSLTGFSIGFCNGVETLGQQAVRVDTNDRLYPYN